MAAWGEAIHTLGDFTVKVVVVKFIMKVVASTNVIKNKLAMDEHVFGVTHIGSKEEIFYI